MRCVPAGPPANLIGMTCRVRTVRVACAPCTDAAGPGLDRSSRARIRGIPGADIPMRVFDPFC